MKKQINSLRPILNRVAAVADDGWYHLVPYGEHPILVDGERFVQVVDEVAADKMVANFNRRRSADPGYLLLVDFEHFSHDEGQKTEAAAWVNALEKRADGVWGKFDLSDLGEAAIRNKRYRSISPVWYPHQTEHLGGDRYRPIEINDAGFTNKANLQGLVPFWNRQDEGQRKKDTRMNKLMALLGLAPDASEESAVAAVEALKKRIADLGPKEEQVTKLTQENDALKNRNKELLTTSVNALLDEHSAVISESGREAWKNRALEDYDGTKALLASITPPDGGGEKTSRKPMTNRQTAGTPEKTPGGTDAQAAKEKKQAAAIRNRASEIADREGVTWPTAWRRAEAEVG